MQNSQSPKEYWAQIEQELGETVRAYALGRVISHDRIKERGMFSPSPEWGLVFLTETALHIDRGSSPNWFQRILSVGKAAQEKERSTIHLSTIREIVIPPAKKGLRRIISAPEVAVDVFLHNGPGLRILLDWRGEKDAQLMDMLRDLQSA